MLNYDDKTLLLLSRDRECLEAVFPTMKMPWLLFSGEMDDPLRIQECARQISNAMFFSLPDLVHGGAITQSELVLPYIKNFLAGLDGEKYS